MVDMVDAVMDDAQETWRQIWAADISEPPPSLFRDAIQSGVRLRAVGDRPVLLPGRSQGLPRPGFLQRAAGTASARPAISRRPTSSRTNSVITCRRSLGVEEQVRQAAGRRVPIGATQLSVRMELQADCYAGVWGSPREERRAAGKVDLESGRHRRGPQRRGRDRRRSPAADAGGRVAPERFTHGTSEQRVSGSAAVSNRAIRTPAILSVASSLQLADSQLRCGDSTPS